jgi:hypothetical protein
MSTLAIAHILSQLYQATLTTEQAEQQLAQTLSKEDLAIHLVDAFNRGWITRFNVGLDDEGNVI